MSRTRARVEFGDFQTPPALAAAVCAVVRARFGAPAAIVEPTCGRGHFVRAAATAFPGARLLGVEVNAEHLAAAAAAAPTARLVQADFFALDWPALLADEPTPVFVIGNPPWVTNAALGALQSENLPTKGRRGLRGMDAVTGRSNFDISEWMVQHLLAALAGRDAALAVLVKTAVARRVLHDAWTQGSPLRDAALFRIDARSHFGASVDACLLVCRTDRAGPARCPLFAHLAGTTPDATLGLADGALVADVDAYDRSAGLVGVPGAWRSGIKHDCAAVLELVERDGWLFNGLGEAVDVEVERRFPLLKSSDVAAGRTAGGRWLIAPQRATGDDTAALADAAPKTWAYLCRHTERLDRRRSRIYRGRPRFAIFGVGPYAFSDWKIAISGLYKSLEFTLVGPVGERPVVFDDTVYLLPCADEAEARARLAFLRSAPAQSFLASFVFWDSTRPVTAALLRRLPLPALDG